MKHYFRAWRRTFDFRSRATRTEYWLFHVVTTVLLLAPFAIALLAVSNGSRGEVPFMLSLLAFFLLSLLHALPTLAVTVRRMHDFNTTGLWLLLILPLAGGIGSIVIGIIEPSPGDNRYGENPRGGYGDLPMVFDDSKPAFVPQGALSRPQTTSRTGFDPRTGALIRS